MFVAIDSLRLFDNLLAILLYSELFDCLGYLNIFGYAIWLSFGYLTVFRLFDYLLAI